MLDLKKVLDRIVEYNDLPKFQVERALSPVLSFFVAPIIDSILETSRSELVAPEFPLKNENNQSTNIDYLVADTTGKRVILVELKTNFRASANDVLGHQEKYLRTVDRIRSETCAFLINDLEEITSVTKEKNKYNYLQKASKKLDTGLKDAHILYLVPKKTAEKLSKKDLRDTTVVSFPELPEKTGDDPSYTMLRDALIRLS